MHRLRPGFVLSARYRLGEQVGSGGMGQVWAATDDVLERRVAIKVMHPQTVEQKAVAERFQAEARYAAQISHPNIVEVFDFGEHDGLTYLVMEFIEGPTLAKLLADNGPPRTAEVRNVLVQLAGALGRAHGHGVVHGDLKPSNVLITPDGLAKLTDFGIAKEVGDPSHTLTGWILGTAHYVSPEQAMGNPITPRSDLYSLGVLGHELLTGTKPFDGANPLAIALAHVEEPPPPLPSDVPDDLRRIIRSCLAKDPGERPEGASAVVLELAASSADSSLAALATPNGGAGTGTGSGARDRYDELPPTQAWSPVRAQTSGTGSATTAPRADSSGQDPEMIGQAGRLRI